MAKVVITPILKDAIKLKYFSIDSKVFWNAEEEIINLVLNAD